jgi:hypothetical protein
MYGKAGCGKTVLSSTVIEDMRLHCNTLPNVGHAVFYFSFSDDHKQAFEDLLRSMAVQLGWKEPGLSMLQAAYDKPNQGSLGTQELEKILLASIASFDAVYLHLDALDECPESGDARQDVLTGIEKFAHATSNLRIFATSRELQDISESMDRVGSSSLLISSQAVDIDIRSYVSSQVSLDSRLNRLNPTTKSLIENTIGSKADGM